MSTAHSFAHPREIEARVIFPLFGVEAPLNYLIPSGEKPVTYTYTPPSGTPQSTRRNDPHKVTIRNARPLAEDLSLDIQGFALVHHRSAVTNFYDATEVREVYYPEVEELLKRRTGAARVVIFDHVVRNADKAERKEDDAREYGRIVHNDYSLKSAPRRVLDHVADDADELLKHRFAEINVWRAIRGPILSTPLAVCDARSIDERDVVACDLVYPHRIGETYAFTYNPNHQWFYFPHMLSDEVVLLKCYDSIDDGRARFTAHSAFDDPSSPADAPARESIEVRALVFFAPETRTPATESNADLERTS
ncbi:MAG TPA: CmcJ/NvfI family oxidoreductase [Candidatus Binataceae bacterium]|nr:CmcJ/NvfI family oxidoreductase [Candidatus Binataceae bacterium]